MTRLYVLWAFVSWCFMKMFGGCFNTAENFRYELKKGAPDSIFAICGFLVISLVTFLVLTAASALMLDDKPTVQVIVFTLFWTIVTVFVYNVIKAAYECFEDERQDLIQRLRT